MKAKPDRQHKWLQQWVGRWTFEIRADNGPGKPPHTLKGRETIRPIGKLWIVADGAGQTPDGGTMTSQMTLGYDPARKRFVGSWVGSPMTHHFVYEGRLGGKTLILETTGPDFFNKRKQARYRDAFEVVDRHHRILRSSYQAPSGRWVTFMTCHYTRAK